MKSGKSGGKGERDTERKRERERERETGGPKRSTSSMVEETKVRMGVKGDIEGPHARAAHRYAITWLQPT